MPPADAPRLRARPQTQQKQPHQRQDDQPSTDAAATAATIKEQQQPRMRSAAPRVLVLVLLAAAAPLCCSLLAAFNSRVPAADLFFPSPSSAPVDAAVVLGYALRRDSTPTPALARRVRAGLRVWRSRASSGRLVFSGAAPSAAAAMVGGRGKGGVGRPTEAAVMARAALRELEGAAAAAAGGGRGGRGAAGAGAGGVAGWRRTLLHCLLPYPLPDLLLPPPASDVLTAEGGDQQSVDAAEAALEARALRTKGWRLERASTSTRENALRSLAMARAEGWRSLAVVTSPWHARRALAAFRRAAEGTGVVRIVVVVAESDGEEGQRGKASWGGAREARPLQRGPWADRLERLHEAFDASVRETAAAALYWARGWT